MLLKQLNYLFFLLLIIFLSGEKATYTKTSQARASLLPAEDRLVPSRERGAGVKMNYNLKKYSS
ncbi:hypothetical protein SAMN03080594_101852 [Arenibacter palladensis]|uniref:Uncharacterized protein n=1 Tax=Arenibacter palladensis TaxID=237373 RepID=A0A1M4V5Z1_9FLAO|nr:hypothetical protein SAMN03080594_101852 [Arenibacter palladensis]